MNHLFQMTRTGATDRHTLALPCGGYFASTNALHLRTQCGNGRAETPFRGMDGTFPWNTSRLNARRELSNEYLHARVFNSRRT